MYRNDDGTIPLEEFMEKAHRKTKKKFEFMLRYISDENNMLCEPYVKHFAIAKYRMLYELRLKAAGVMVRIIYYKADENMILLHAFYKRDKKDTEHALDYALKLLNFLEGKVLMPFENLVEVEIK